MTSRLRSMTAERDTGVPGIAMPHPDELLYSVIARSSVRLGVTSPKRLMEIFYGRQGVVAVPDLPARLACLVGVARVDWGLQPAALIRRHTLAGYFTHWLGDTERERLFGQMFDDAYTALHLRLGICAGSVRSHRWFQICERCVIEDVDAFGEAIWRRAHQLPGVRVCHRHGIPLHITTVPVRARTKHLYVPASLSLLSSAVVQRVDARSAEQFFWLSSESHALLDADGQTTGPIHDYRAALSMRGFGRGTDADQRLRAALVETLGEGFLRELFRGQDGSLAWLRLARLKPRRGMHPLKHLLLQRLIEVCPVKSQGETFQKTSSKTWGLYRDPGLRQRAAILAKTGMKTRAIAKALQVDWKTAFRLQSDLPETPERQLYSDAKVQWSNLIAAFPSRSRTELRGLSPALYATLYRNERAWLLAQPCGSQGAVAARSNVRRVNWSARDAELASQVRRVAEELYLAEPPVRVSRSRVLGLLGRQAMVAQSSHLLPELMAALAAVCEDVSQFQQRRVSLVKQAAQAVGGLPDWRVLRAAKINPARFPCKGQELLKHDDKPRKGAGGSSTGTP